MSRLRDAALAPNGAALRAKRFRIDAVRVTAAADAALLGQYPLVRAAPEA